MSTLERAIAIAAEAHAGVVDRGGAPYILHPLRVMQAVDTPEQRIVAILHDVLEDCPDWPSERLEAKGFSSTILEALKSVTKFEGESYEQFVERAGRNPIGRAVKVADLQDNLRRERIPHPTDADQRRWAKYQAALASLS